MLKLHKLYPDAIEPTRAHDNDSGLDVYAYLPGGDVILAPGKLNIKYSAARMLRRFLDGFSPDYSEDDVLLTELNHIARIPLGFSIQLPQQASIVTEKNGLKYKLVYEAQLRGRSGLASKGIFCHWGTIDNSYSGEMHAILINQSSQPFVIPNKAKIAQLVVQTVLIPEIIYTDDFEPTLRGSNGFGSTGV